MSDLVDRLINMTISVVSPDGNLHAKADSEQKASFWFQDEDQFYEYGPESLESQVSALITSLSTARRIGIRQAYRAEGREYEVEDHSAETAAWRRYHEAIAESQPVGVSPTGLVALGANSDFSICEVDIDADIFADSGPSEFIQELNDAYRYLLDSQKDIRSLARRKHLKQ